MVTYQAAVDQRDAPRPRMSVAVAQQYSDLCL